MKNIFYILWLFITVNIVRFSDYNVELLHEIKLAALHPLQFSDQNIVLFCAFFLVDKYTCKVIEDLYTLILLMSFQFLSFFCDWRANFSSWFKTVLPILVPKGNLLNNIHCLILIWKWKCQVPLLCKPLHILLLLYCDFSKCS